ncbi:hypothetical protein [Peredibacter starrii]|uniref:Uncharacterized protein n=1 Tax=Peredibacter starrii TaxID=28202 RepID=A0AAX4HP77_9BACT|nr:hypothetical protein [Peredibacter starrii]WPU64902.1 hypothetical protein SOO65_19590 [Peredibacter starrii]
MQLKGILGLLICAFTNFAWSQVFLNVPAAQDSQHFFPIYNQILNVSNLNPTSEVFGDLSSKSENRIRKIPSQFLEGIGIREGTQIQSTRNPVYTVKKEVFVYLYNDPFDSSNYWNRFHLILTDDVKIHNSISKDEASAARYINGFAYTGSSRKLQMKLPKKVSTVVLQKSDPLFNFDYFKNFDKTKIRVAGLLDFTIYILPVQNQEGIETIVLRTKKGRKYSLSTNLSVVDKNFKLEVSEDFKGLRTLQFREAFHSDSCDTLYFLGKDEEITKVRLPCNDR